MLNLNLKRRFKVSTKNSWIFTQNNNHKLLDITRYQRKITKEGQWFFTIVKSIIIYCFHSQDFIELFSKAMSQPRSTYLSNQKKHIFHWISKISSNPYFTFRKLIGLFEIMIFSKNLKIIVLFTTRQSFSIQNDQV